VEPVPEGREHPSLTIRAAHEGERRSGSLEGLAEPGYQGSSAFFNHTTITGELVPRAERSAAGSSGRPLSGRAMSGTE